MHTETIFAAACAVALSSLTVSGDALSDKAITDKVLQGSIRSTYRIIQHEIDVADRAADAAWLALETPAQLRAHQQALFAGMTAAVGGFPARSPLNAKVLRKHE